MTVKASEIGLVSADSHVNEPRDLWSSNLPASLRDQAMRGLRSDGDGDWGLVFDGQHIFQKDMQAEQDRLAVLDPARRLDIMRQDGVVAEAIFPTIGLYVWSLPSEGGAISCRIYNEWIYEQLHRHSPRFCCAGLVPTWTPEQAVAEVEYIAERGLGAIMLPAIVEPMWNHRQWNPMWDAIGRTGLPVVMHQGTGHSMLFYRGPGATVSNLIASQSMGPRVATMLATSGVLERHPDLHVVLVEYNAGWLAWTMETMDYYDTAFRRYDEFARTPGVSGQPAPSSKPTVYPDLEHPPSYYVARQIHSTFQKDTIGIRNIPSSGVNALMWGNDYPHEEGTYPHSRKIVDEQAEGLDELTARRIFRENAIEVFKFDEAELAVL